MPPGNPTRLLKLADREFRQLTEDKSAAPPPPRRFRPIRLNTSRFDQSWDRKRGSAARMMAVLRRLRQVGSNEDPQGSAKLAAAQERLKLFVRPEVLQS